MELSKKIPLQRTELLLAYLLRFGVIFCCSIIAVGTILSFFRATHYVPNESLQNILHGQTVATPIVPESWDAFRFGLLELDANAVIALGLIFLIALPILRVAMTIVLFLIERDWVYFWVTSLVFFILITSLYLGRIL